MDWNSLIGRRYEVDSQTPTAETIEAFAQATNDPNPRYLGSDPVASPLYPVRLFHPLMFTCTGDEDLKLDMLKLVHGEEDLTYHQAITAGETVDLHANLESISQKTKGLVVGWRLHATVGGAPRVECYMSVFVRGQMLDGLEPGTTLGSVPATGTADTEGEPLAQQTMEVALDQTQRYAAASLDVNPIHLDEAVAKKAGLPSVILHGLCTMAFGGKAIVDSLLDGDSSRLHRYSVRFSRPVLLGQKLTTRIWKAGEVDGRDAFAVDMINDDGQAVMTAGWVEVARA